MSAPETPPITVRAGTAEPPSMAFPPGKPVGPLAIGRNATWRVVAPGVLEEHAFLYFDGNALFLQSANVNAPVTVNGSPVPSEWTPVYAPCEIAFGSARLWFGPPATPSVPAPAPAEGPRKPFVPRVQGLDVNDESTRMQPIDEIRASRRPAQVAVGPTGAAVATLKSAAPSSMPSPGGGGFAGFGAPPTVMGGPPVSAVNKAAPSAFDPPTPFMEAPPMGPGPLFGPPPPAPSAPMAFPGPGAPPLPTGSAAPPIPGAAAPPGKNESWLGARWRESSGPKKALTLLLGPLVWAVWVIFTDKPAPPPKPKPAPTAATSASAAPSADPSAGASAGPAVEPPTPPPTPSATPSTTPSGKASAGPVSMVKTPQREAADAVASGAYDKAARLYDELAKAHPEVPAYAEAARIMKAKAGRK